MIKALLFMFVLILAGTAFPQVSLTVNVPAAGGLYAAMTAEQRNTVTNLTVTGLLNATDFVTLRDSMPVLSVLDISATSIMEYTGTGGPGGVGQTYYPADEIPYSAFWYNGGKATLTEALLPQTLYSVGSYAFQGCTGLLEANFPASVDSIQYSAYAACSGMVETNIPSTIQYIGYDAFASCGGNIYVDANNPGYSSLDGVLFNKTQSLLIQCPDSKTGYIIPSTVTTIGVDAFIGCALLGSVTIPLSVTSIQPHAFTNCHGLSSVELPASISTIEYSVFSGCTGLQSITIPSSIDSIGDVSFAFCTSLTVVNLPNSISYIGMMSFWGCTGLTSVNFPPQLVSIMQQAFKGCTSLVEAILPSSINTVNVGTFAGCTGLLKVVLPPTINNIQSQAFYNCTALEEIHANNPLPVDLSASINVFYNVPVETCILYVPVGSKVLYEVAPKWEDFDHIVEDIYAGIYLPGDQEYNARVNNGILSVLGLKSATYVSVYAMNGSQIYSKKVETGNVSIPLLGRGTYIVRCNNYSIKVIY
jgi:hypothetical protein